MNIAFYKADINRIFKENNLYYAYFILDTDEIFGITIEDGDWKHDHIRLNHIMLKNNYKLIKEEKIGTSDEDSYSSTHYFKYGA